MSIRLNISKWVLRTTRSYFSRFLGDLTKVREKKEYFFGLMKPPRKVQFEEGSLEHMTIEWCYPPAYKQEKMVMYYLHGGGYASCSTKSHRGLVGKLSLELGMRVYGINYRLAPENPYPAALDDAIRGYEFLLQTYSPEQIIIAGDSAGGGLSLATLVRIKELGLPQPLTAVLLSPWTDLTFSGASAQTDNDPLLPLDATKEWAAWYSGQHPTNHPHISPIFADLSGLAPTLVQVGTDEILLDDSTRLQGKEGFTVEIWQGGFHVFQMAWRTIPEADEAIQKIVAYLEKQIQQIQQSATV